MIKIFASFFSAALLISASSALAGPWAKTCEGVSKDAAAASTYEGLARLAQVTWKNPAASCTALESELLKIKIIDLRGQNLSDFKPVYGLTHITQLLASGNRLTSLEGVEALKQLAVLDLGDNSIESLEPLTSLVQLKQVRLAKNKIQSVQPLTQLLQLEKLSLAYNQIQDVSGLTVLTKLNYLTLASNQLTQLEPLKKLGELQVLNVSFNKVCGPSAWQGFASKETKIIGREFQSCPTKS